MAAILSRLKKPTERCIRKRLMEGLAFLIDSRAIAHDPELRRITGGAILAAPQCNRAHFQFAT